jgi:hypothetical protein
MEASLRRIQQALAASHVGPVWNPGCLDATGPTAAFHGVADGTSPGAPHFESFELMSLAESTGEKAMMDKLATDEAWEPSWWSPSWFPFAGDHAGQLLVVDGATGEVIEFMHDDEARPLVAPSLEAYFATVATRLEAGELIHDVRHGIIDPALREKINEVNAKARATADAAQQQTNETMRVVSVISVIVALAVGAAVWFEVGR